MKTKTTRWACMAVVCVLGATVGADDDDSFGLDERVPWTTSGVVGTPEPPPPYTVEPAFPKLKFNRPTVITNLPTSNRLFVAEQSGKVFSFANDSAVETRDLVIDLKAARPELGNVYGLTFHPQYQRNRFVYICYTAGNKADGTRVSRFQMTADNPPKIDADTEQSIITWPSGGHNGGCLKFGPDGYLYVTTGDGAGPNPPDSLLSGQDVSTLLSSILRIDIDNADGERAYQVPSDNPFVDLEGARPEIWSYGFRNPWKMSFDRQTGSLWVGDVGWELWEMIYKVERGGNYGWSITEGPQPVLTEQQPGPTPISPPTIAHPHSEAASITGGFVYHGIRLPPLTGKYIYGDYQSGILWAATLQDDEVSEVNEIAHTSLRLVGFGEDNSGELYLLDYQGDIHRLVENPVEDNSKKFPRKLSETGLFTSVADQTPAAGVMSYSIIAPAWADHATAQRWMAVPDGTITIDGKGNWQFPDGSVIAKTISMPGLDAPRLETQIIHREAGAWRPYSYAWNVEQTDAELVDVDGFNRELRIEDASAPGGVREQTYRFAGRKECLLCHNPWVEARTTIFGVQSASLLAVRQKQLNRLHDYGDRTANQIATLQHIGLLPNQIESERPLVDPHDTAADLDARARSYLHTNCQHCHQRNAGGVATIALAYDLKLADTKTVNVRPAQGTFNITGAKVIAPGDPLGSVLFYRMSKTGGGRMPRVGSREVDRRGVDLIHDWIKQLPVDSNAGAAEALAVLRDGGSADKARADAITRLTASTRGALSLSRALARGELPADARGQVVAATKNHAKIEVRDLFERFVPPGERIKRLGTVVNRAELLALEADVARGRQVFFNNTAAACKNCHRIEKQGQALGPDLDQIGKKYRRDQLLTHILEPSKFIEPKYVPYLLETAEGQVLSGLLVSKDDQAVVLKDAKNKEHRVPATDVELLVRQQKSLMPDLLLRDLTKQEVADLLALLASLK